jgi:TRAP-type mannitol/chloroaromatic compound transport system substrate-binding protein
MQAKYDAKNPQALKDLVASGTRLFRMPKPVMEAAFKAAEAEYARLAEKNPHWKEIYADYAVFRREQNQWFRYAEAGFDSFMQSQKTL